MVSSTRQIFASLAEGYDLAPLQREDHYFVKRSGYFTCPCCRKSWTSAHVKWEYGVTRNLKLKYFRGSQQRCKSCGDFRPETTARPIMMKAQLRETFIDILERIQARATGQPLPRKAPSVPRNRKPHPMEGCEECKWGAGPPCF